jgi:uncharacterized membrane protein YbhN (UPF0104 family)
MVPAHLRRAFHWAGGAVAAVGIIFIALRLNEYGNRVAFEKLSSGVWLVTAVSALIYCFSNILLALAWWRLLVHFKVTIPRQWAVTTYGISQLGKYVPGNIFHLAGRQAMGLAAGLPGWSLAKSVLWELGLIAFAGAMFGLLTLPILMPSFPMLLGLGVFIAGILSAVAGINRFLGAGPARAFYYYLCFLAISGLLFLAVLTTLSSSATAFDASWVIICGAYVIAWLVGLVTPGAPAGVGVRELVLIFFLRGSVSEGELLLAAVLGRIVTVTGDFLFFALTSLKSKKVFRN